ncbi:outer membrane protein assembly factor BamA [Kangiella sp. HZ709]|uniref:outer membrane protein assembly factor BamA n=1 Tax=Kangiella sp. HZ709 TaxID=2666328 RepID=UPI0012AFACFD|nr:outer membrane protein assembly factor BamA [Kangiella sp. HZ709]MRX28322.1 outer membrane protein assembly factor BamA [Kangiella sp. HZ709]
MRLITKTLTVLLISLAAAKAQAIEPFVVEDIQVEGLQRVELGTFFTTLPIRVGETLDEARVPNIIRAVYKTGNFDSVKLQKEGLKLKITVVERPTVASIVISGNKVLKTDQIEAGLSASGVMEKEPFNPFVLEKIKQEITSQYFANGKYDVDINVRLGTLSRNRVNLFIEVEEGQSALIADINIIGNKLFTDEELISQIESTTGGMFSFISNDNKYARQTLDKDIETLTSFYKDRGYLDFSVTDTNISLSQNQRDLYISLKVKEGELYYINEVKILGDFQIEKDVIEAMMPFKEGDKYSHAILKFYEEQVEEFLGFYGYTYPEVKTFPEKLADSNEVDLNILINPGKRFYVDKIEFAGTSDTDENVFRREFRIREGEPLSSKLIDRSKLRLQRLPFVEKVDIKNKVSEEHPNKIDLDVNIEERGAAQISGSLGYNDRFGITLQGNLSHSNFLGEGKNVGLGLSFNRAQESINASYSDPYFFNDNLGFTSSLSFRKTDFEELNIFNGQSLDTISLGLGLVYPIGEFTSLNYGFSYQDNTLKAPGSFDLRVLEFFESFGQDPRTEPNLDFVNFSLNFGWQTNKLNRGIFPTNGYSHSVALEVGTPIGDTEFYKVNYNFRQYFPLTSDNDWIISVRANLGYGEGLGDTSRLPYFENFFAGGAGSLRGFEPNTIGPRSIQLIPSTSNIPGPFPGGGNDTISFPPAFDTVQIGGFSIGGDSLATASLELIFPIPFADNNNVRASLFVDAGNVWDSQFNVSRFDGLNIINNNNRQFDSVPDFADPNSIRVSSGLALQWWSPLGPLMFSFSNPIDKQFYDEVKTFTFTIGQTF